ncbi:MAG: hypothetical protein M3Q29_22095 [Chloroflexota bacterium]|nr:hypothetical protein [Chloroflexota bacterium]
MALWEDVIVWPDRAFVEEAQRLEKACQWLLGTDLELLERGLNPDDPYDPNDHDPVRCERLMLLVEAAKPFRKAVREVKQIYARALGLDGEETGDGGE